MDDILDRLDAAINRTCPCGADPRPGDPYCSDDCTPTHVAHDTDTRMSGDYATAMRWRPDLVTAHDDTDLTLIEDEPARTEYTGQFNPSVYERNPNTYHLRLDDGHRYVGVDVPINDTNGRPGSTATRRREAWEKLERQLTDSRYAEPDDDQWARAWPGSVVERWFYADQRGRSSNEAQASELRNLPGAQVWIAPVGADPATRESWTEVGTASEVGIAYQPSGAITWDNPDSNPLEDIRNFMRQREAIFSGMVRTAEQGIRDMQSTVRQFIEQTRDAEEPERHPMLAAIEARRNRNTGPEQRHRPPRQIGPRRTR